MLTLKDIALRLISIMITVISEKRISGLRDYVETTLLANIVINSDIISAMIIEVDRDVAKSQVPANFSGWKRALLRLKLLWKTKTWATNFEGAVE